MANNERRNGSEGENNGGENNGAGSVTNQRRRNEMKQAKSSGSVMAYLG